MGGMKGQGVRAPSDRYWTAACMLARLHVRGCQDPGGQGNGAWCKAAYAADGEWAVTHHPGTVWM